MVGAWGGYANGRIPTSAMVQAEPGKWLHPTAAASWQKMDAACPHPLSISESYRDIAGQEYYWNRYIKKLPGWTVAARPGTSNHGWGLAVDINQPNGPAFNWLVANGARYGWSWATGKASGERWHWEYVGAISGAGSGTKINKINAELGSSYVSKLQTQLSVGVDGDAGPTTTKALQTKIGTAADGDFGTNSVRALQTFIGAGVDGNWGAETTAKFKAAIDSGKFGSVPVVPSDPYVLEAQQLLNKVGYSLTEDGVKGDATIAAIKDYQTKNGLTVDGIAGDATKASIRAKIAAATPPAPISTYYRPTDAPAGSLFGVDVSKYQAGFDFAAYAATGEDFVILKRGGSNGDTYIDSQYQSHLPAARAAGLKIGHYWFNGRDGVASPTASAQAFLKDLDIKPGEIVALDIENDGPLLAYTAAEALEWLDAVHTALGVRPLVYMSSSVARQAQWGVVAAAGYKLWVAMYSWIATSPNAGKYKPNDVDPLGPWGAGDSWQIHQYTSTVFGTIPGTTSKSLDRNISKSDTFSVFGFVKYPEVVVPEPNPDPEIPVEPETPVEPEPAPPAKALNWWTVAVGGVIGLVVIILGLIGIR